MPFTAYNPSVALSSHYGASHYGAPSVVPSGYHQPFGAGSIAPYGGYGGSMYSPDDDYFGYGGGGYGGSYYGGHGGSLYGHGGSYYGGHGGSPYGHGGSYYGHHGYPGSRPYMGHEYGYDYDDDYYGDPYYQDRYHDPHYHSSRYRHRYSHYDRGHHNYYRAMSALYAPKAYQITGDGGVKTLRYGHEHFKDKLRRYCGLDPRGLKGHR